MIKRPSPKNKPFSESKGPDVLQILPVTPDRELILIELNLPNGEKSYRIIEEYFDPKLDVAEMLKILIKISGLSSKKNRLIHKGQPFSIRDTAAYVFLCEQTEMLEAPDLNFKLAYSLVSFKPEVFNKLVDQNKIENATLMKDYLRPLN